MTRKPHVNTSLGVAGLAGLLAVAAGLGPAPALADDAVATGGLGSPGETSASSVLPATLPLTGVIRDFKERTVTGGHPDFERKPTGGFAHYQFQCADALDEDGKPVFASAGRKVSTQYRDGQGRNVIAPRAYIASRPGDLAGSVASTTGGSVTSADTFRNWWRDNPQYNVSMPLSITLVRQPGTSMYVFDDRSDQSYSSLGGFFPINGQLFGNSGGTTPTRNHHFTFELDTTFVYREGGGQVFTFIGDDDVYVFVDGKCVIDIGGVHSAVSQTIELDRLDWLEDGRTYSLKFFFAERHRTQSNFRIETTISLRNAELPPVSGFYD